MKSLHGIAAWIFVLAMGSSWVAEAQTYSYIDLGASGAGNSGASGINNLGQVVGYSRFAGTTGSQATLWNGTTATALGGSGAMSINEAGQITGAFISTNYHAALWSGTVMTDLGTLGGQYSYGVSINNSGQIAGLAYTQGWNNYYATLWNGTTATNLGTLGGTSSQAIAINDAGLVAGASLTTGNTAEHATVWSGTTAIDLGTLGGTHSAAIGINNAGAMVGYSYVAGDATAHATLWSGSTVTDLGALAGYMNNSEARDINNEGIVVGRTYDLNLDGGVGHATLWNGTTVTDLNTFIDPSMARSGWVLMMANAINDNGWIAGTAININTWAQRAFLLTYCDTCAPEIVSTPIDPPPIDPPPITGAVPEPETYAMLLAGLGLLGLTARRRRQKQNA